MDLDRPKELIRQAVIRDGHRCSICGRPCGEDEARRHSEPGAFGDSAMSFAAMCYACQTWLAHEGMKPAQHITHFYDSSKARMQLRRVIDRGALALVLGFYGGLAILGGFIIYQTPKTPFDALGGCLLLLLLFAIGRLVVQGLHRVPGLHPRFDDTHQNRERPLITWSER